MSGKAQPRLLRRLVLEDPQRSDDGAGGFVETWVARGTLWAEVKSLTGRAGAQGGASLSLHATGLPCAPRPPVRHRGRVPDQRFREDARIFRIDAVAEADPAGRYLTCLATEEVSV